MYHELSLLEKLGLVISGPLWSSQNRGSGEGRGAWTEQTMQRTRSGNPPHSIEMNEGWLIFQGISVTCGHVDLVIDGSLLHPWTHCQRTQWVETGMITFREIYSSFMPAKKIIEIIIGRKLGENSRQSRCTHIKSDGWTNKQQSISNKADFFHGNGLRLSKKRSSHSLRVPAEPQWLSKRDLTREERVPPAADITVSMKLLHHLGQPPYRWQTRSTTTFVLLTLFLHVCSIKGCR